MNIEISIGSVVTGVITGVFAVVAVIVANRLTLRRSQREKIWDLRRQAYGEILSALSQVETVLDIADEYIQEGLSRYFEEDVSTTHNKRISDHLGVARKKFSDDYLVLSAKFTSCFEEMEKNLSRIGADPNQTDVESHMEFDAEMRKYRPLLLEIARSEILSEKEA